MRKILWYGDAAVTQVAVEDFVENLKLGEPIAGALEAFCRDVIENAEPFEHG